MEDWEALDVTDAAKQSARRLGMYGNIDNRLRRMARDSVPFRHARCNRRFEGYLMLIKGGQILALEEFSARDAEARRDQLAESEAQRRNRSRQKDPNAGGDRFSVERKSSKTTQSKRRVEQDGGGATIEFLQPGSRWKKG